MPLGIPRPGSAVVEEQWALTDLSTDIAQLGPQRAFQVIKEHVFKALDEVYVEHLQAGLYEDAAAEGSIPRIHGWQPRPTPEIVDRVTTEIHRRISERFDPILPAIRGYVLHRRTDPVVAVRLSGLLVELEPYGGEHRRTFHSGHEALGLELAFSLGTVDHDHWRTLYDALLELADGLGEGFPQEESSTLVLPAVEAIKWKGSVQVLAWLFRELAEKGWIEAPLHRSSTTRFNAGDIVVSQYAKVLAPHFAEVNPTTLERELKPQGSTVPAQDVEDFRIPEKPRR